MIVVPFGTINGLPVCRNQPQAQDPVATYCATCGHPGSAHCVPPQPGMPMVPLPGCLICTLNVLLGPEAGQ